MEAPAEVYRQRLDARRADEDRRARADTRLSLARLAVFALGVAIALAAMRDVLPAGWLIVPVLAFGVLIAVHERVLQHRSATRRGIAFYERGLARIEDRWPGTGATGDRFRDDRHPYANDLDLFGRGSLFELLSIAATPAGEETLAGWLKAPAAHDAIRARQAAVSELTRALDLRESLGRAALDVRSDVHTEPLLAWAEQPPLLSPPWLRVVTAAFIAAVIAAGGWFVTTGQAEPVVAVLVLQSLFVWPQMGRIVRALHSAAAVARDLDTLSHLLERIESESFEAPQLRDIQRRLMEREVTASRAVRTLHRLVEIHEWQHNLIFLVISLPFLLGAHLAWAIESWRRRHGRSIRRWLEAAGEFEALASLSAYRFEHPGDPFPTLMENETGARFEADALGHPLLPSAHMVRNDVHLDTTTRLLVVSGSNMSGKSTLLRTVGVNAVLALTGAPVRAAGLRLTPMAIGATLRIQDSLQEGRSRFYAEITRIRELAAVAVDGPLLFLLDELFHGTNSHDRLVGASGVLRSFLDRGAVGLVTTHDLALTAIADHLGARAANVHFEEWFDGGEMRFDYRLKPGRVTRSNALALMRAVGLEVDDDVDAATEHAKSERR